MTASEGQHRRHDVRFPGESDDYRRARDELLDAEIELRGRIETVAEQRRSLPLGGEVPDDYGFEEYAGDTDDAGTVRLSELFEDGKDTLLLYSFMFDPDEAGNPLAVACPACTSIIDSLDAEAPHIMQRVNLAASTKAPIQRFREHARSRGWRNIRLLSSANTTYNHDYHTESANGKQDPIATVFVRRDGKIHHFWSSELYFVPTGSGQGPRHVDFMWPLWNVFDRAPEGRGSDWGPRLKYG
jgi:predicted dithiol-disulfide oxidoreductase (DUF899 family)